MRARATIYAPSRMSYGGDVSQEFALQFIIEVKVAPISSTESPLHRHWSSGKKSQINFRFPHSARSPAIQLVIH